MTDDERKLAGRMVNFNYAFVSYRVDGTMQNLNTSFLECVKMLKKVYVDWVWILREAQDDAVFSSCGSIALPGGKIEVRIKARVLRRGGK